MADPSPPRRPAAAPVGLRDVARAAGVSVASASVALNGRSGVAELTRARILETAQRLGYRANPQAQALRRGRTTTYGLVIRKGKFLTPAAQRFADLMHEAIKGKRAAGSGHVRGVNIVFHRDGNAVQRATHFPHGTFAVARIRFLKGGGIHRDGGVQFVFINRNSRQILSD